MKHLFITLVLLLAACKEDEPAPQQQQTDQGCMTGVNFEGDRVFVRCCTIEQFQAGSNVNRGGTRHWSDYTSHKWEKCSQCQ